MASRCEQAVISVGLWASPPRCAVDQCSPLQPGLGTQCSAPCAGHPAQSLIISSTALQLFGPAILNVDVMEAVKSGSVQQRLRLSTPLTVTCPGMGTEQYEDIDDLIANFITPYLDHVRDIVSLCLRE